MVTENVKKTSYYWDKSDNAVKKWQKMLLRK